MTALLVVERCRDLDRFIVCPPAPGSSSGIGLRPGDRIQIRQAMYALMVKSANDSAYVLACTVGGSQQGFVALMNRRAAELGLRDTHYGNPTGAMRDDRHRSSVYDLARLGRYAMRSSAFRRFVGQRHVVVRWLPHHRVAVTSNNLLLTREWADGIKCGNTPAAGFCLVGCGKPGLRSLVMATLAAPSRDVDALDQVALFEWASTLYERKTLVSVGEVVRTPVGERRRDGGCRGPFDADRGRAQCRRRVAHVHAAGHPAHRPRRRGRCWAASPTTRTAWSSAP